MGRWGVLSRCRTMAWDTNTSRQTRCFPENCRLRTGRPSTINRDPSTTEWMTQAFRLNGRLEEPHSHGPNFRKRAAAALIIHEAPFIIVARRCLSCVNEQPLCADTVHQYDITCVRQRRSVLAVRNLPPSILRRLRTRIAESTRQASQLTNHIFGATAEADQGQFIGETYCEHSDYR